MAKLTTSDLEGIRQAQKERMAFRDRTYLLICGGTGCHATGAIRVKDALVDAINEKGLGEKVQVIETGCNGFCAMGPILVVHPRRHLLSEAHRGGYARTGRVPPDQRQACGTAALQRSGDQKQKSQPRPRSPFSPTRCRGPCATRGLIDPESIDEYIGRDGYVGCGQGDLRHDPRADHRRDEDVRHARARRCRVPYGPEMGFRQPE